ncbi:MAG: substrate-binding domain-containing protein [Gaiellales bacterium]
MDVLRRSAGRRRQHRAAVLAITAFAVVAVAGSALAAVSTVRATSAEVPVSKLPKSVQQYYEGVQYVAKVQTNPYAKWTPPKAPWKFCLNESFLANSWRQLTMNEFQKLVGQYRKAKLAKGDLVVTNSNGNPTVQITQFNSLVSQGCNVIVSFPASPTALCPAFAKARAKGVLVMTDHSQVDCPDVINVGFNSYKEMKIGAEGVFKALNGKGNVVYSTGIKGTPTQNTLEIAVADAKKKYPDIDVLGEFEGKWTPSIAQTEMAKFLTTHPQKIDGLVDFGAMGVGLTNALEQAGRPYAKVNSPTAECSAMALWKEHPEVATVATSLDPIAGAYHTFYVAARMLKGGKPIVNNIIFPIPKITPSNLNQWFKPFMTRSADCFAKAPGTRAVPDSYFDVFFKGGQPIKPIKP